MTPADILLLLAGLLLLFAGAEGLVRGSSSIALKLGIKPVIVGLTVVAFGTSAPELVVSLKAALIGNSSIALGNVVGSNIANIALILGISALIRPLNINSTVVKRDIPVMLGVSLLLILLLIDGDLGLADGLVLMAGIVLYNMFNIYFAKKEKEEVEKEFEKSLTPGLSGLASSILIIAGLAFLIFGANIFLSAAVTIARQFNISDAVIGLTIVAVGTSLPELITSIVASYKKEADIAIGNVVGSNTFNILGILGITVLVSPFKAEGINYIDLGVMLAAAAVLLPLSRTGLKITRTEGFFLLTGYFVYIYFTLPH